jgi:hypothetical protein
MKRYAGPNAAGPRRLATMAWNGRGAKDHSTVCTSVSMLRHSALLSTTDQCLFLWLTVSLPLLVTIPQ